MAKTIDEQVYILGTDFKDFVLRTARHPWHVLSDEVLQDLIEQYKKERHARK